MMIPQFKKKSLLGLPIVLVVIAFLYSAYVIFFPTNINAAAPFTLSGYAWSENVGWISFNCIDGSTTGNNVCASSNYSVRINGNMTLSGYAWSEHVGWVEFGNIGCPSGNKDIDGTCGARVIPDGAASWQITGWARALAYSDPEAGGWDGWISLNCENNNECGNSNYALKITPAGSMRPASFAWGDEVSGWIDFSQITINNICPVAIVQRCIDSDTSEKETGDLWCGASTTVTTDCNTTIGELCNATNGRCEIPTIIVNAFTVCRII